MKKVVIALSIVLMLFAFASCDNSTPGTKAEFKVEASIAKVPGVTVTLEDMTKKAFSLEGGDSEARVTQFGSYGELDCVNISVSGTVKNSDCNDLATPMDATGEPITDGSAANYYTDFFEFLMLLPEEAAKYEVSDGLPVRPISNLSGSIDSEGYYHEKVQWLLGDANKSSWAGCGVGETNDGYFYYAFYNETDEEEPIREFFVRVDYSNLKFTD